MAGGNGHVGFTGTGKSHTTPKQRVEGAALLRLWWAEGARWFHHGDCVKADEEFHQIARDIGYNIVIHPPDNDKKRAYCGGWTERREMLPYLMRNHAIVDECDRLLAAPREQTEQLRSGTWATVRYARKKGIAVHILYP